MNELSWRLDILMKSFDRNSNIYVSHFVGLRGVGGVQSNFVEYINYVVKFKLNYGLKHKVYTLGEVDKQYNLFINVLNIKKPRNFISLILDIISKKTIVHFYNNLTSLKLTLLFSVLPVQKIVLHERGAIWNSVSSRGLFLRFVAWKSSLIIANSNATKVMLEKKFYIPYKKIRVLHNGIDISKCNKKKLINKPSSVFRVGFIGRLDSPKGVHVLIEAMHYLADYNIKLTIAGDGVLKEVLKKKAHGLDNVSFVGRIIDPYFFLNGLDLLVVPSIREPLGNVCLEAGLCKVPVLAANVDGLPEIIKNKVSGELILPSKKVSFETVNMAAPLPEFVVNPITQELELPKQIDPFLLSHKILEMRDDPDTLIEYGEELHNRVVEYFSIERYTDELHNIYCEVML